MPPTPLFAMAHGGAEADPAFADGPRRAAQAALARMRDGADALDAVVEAVRLLEDDARFNAGLGSNLRVGGRAGEMDAALVDSRGRFAGVMGLTDVRNPVLVARDLLSTPHPVLAGPGATRFARARGHAPFDPRTPQARERLERFLADADTVGAVAFDGETFAAAGSTGGLIDVLEGRVSDIALPGCGLDAGPRGAVCVSGVGDDIIRTRVAARALRRLDAGAAPQETADEALAWLPPGRALALLVLGREGGAAAGRAPFPWARAEATR